MDKLIPHQCVYCTQLAKQKFDPVFANTVALSQTYQIILKQNQRNVR